MTDDTDGDGDPDGGQVQTTDAWRRFSGAADCTFTLVYGYGAVDGKWWRINKTANTDSSLLFTQSGNVAPDVTPGNTIGYGFVLEIASADDTTRIDVWATQIDNNAVVPFRITLTDLQEAIEPFRFYYEAVVPAGMTELRFWIEIKDGLADFRIGQFTVRDLGA